MFAITDFSGGWKNKEQEYVRQTIAINLFVCRFEIEEWVLQKI